jgi:hypothetical protein
MRLLVRLSLIGLVALVAIGFVINQSMKSVEKKQAAKQVIVTDGTCTESGVRLTVNFGTKAQLREINRCVSNFESTSWDLLTVGHLNVEGTQKYPVGFVCRLNNFPSEKEEPCQDTPSARVGSWAYFISPPGSSSWQYSTWGASTHKPSCGSAEAWIFRYPEENLEIPPTVKPQTSVCLSE